MAKNKKKAVKKQYRNIAFQRALGEHCRELRIKKGYSVNRLAAESEGLSPSAIIRLEHGSGAVTVANLYRFADVLELRVEDLFKFPFEE
jgi:transcriptional regulator with XRE-family HTH domain